MLSHPAVLAFALFLLLLLANVPLFAALAVAALGALWLFDIAPLSVAPLLFSATLDSFPLLATPLFIIAGQLMSRMGLADRLVALAQALFGRLPGGLAVTAIAAGVLLGAISGSNVATVAALSFLIGAMADAGYPRPFAVAVVAAGCTFGVVIPPSIGLIVYGVITQSPIPQLFAAGIAPGLAMAAILIGYVVWVSRARGYGNEVAATPRWVALKSAGWGLLMPVLVLGGIYGGVFTATEAAAVAVVYLLLLEALLYRRLGRAGLYRVLAESGRITGVVGMVIAAAALFAWLLRTQGAATLVAQLLAGIGDDSPLLLLLAVNLILLLIGAFIEPLSAIYLLVPLLQPALDAAGIDPVHFGAIMTVNLSMAHLTPPVGLALYLAAQIGGVPFARAARAALPFVACELLVILLLILFPPLALFLPSLL